MYICYIILYYIIYIVFFYEKVVTQTSAIRNLRRLFPCKAKLNGKVETPRQDISRYIARCYSFSWCDKNYLKEYIYVTYIYIYIRKITYKNIYI